MSAPGPIERALFAARDEIDALGGFLRAPRPESIGPAVIASWPSTLPPATDDAAIREIADRVAAMRAAFDPSGGVVPDVLAAALARQGSLYPVGTPTIEGTHCACGNQRSARRRCCRACERYFWSRSTDLARPAVAVPRCARTTSRLSSEVCPAITALTVALAVSVRHAHRGRLGVIG